MGHLPFPLLAAHFLFASATRIKVAFPTQMAECRNKLTLTNNVLGIGFSPVHIVSVGLYVTAHEWICPTRVHVQTNVQYMYFV
jgi:hypothetical protein